MTNRILLFAAGFCLLAACSSKTGEEIITAQPSADAAEPASSEELSVQGSGVSVHWVHEPDLKLDFIYELEANSYYGIPETTYNESRGYPQDWDETGKPEYAELMESDDYDIPEKDEYYYGSFEPGHYTPDAIAVVSEGRHGIFDYSGNPLMAPCVSSGTGTSFEIEYYPDEGFGFSGDEHGFYTEYLDYDFRNVVPGHYGGIGGDPGIGYYVMDSVLYHMGNENRIEDGTVINDAYGHNCLVKIVSPGDNPYQSDIIGYAAYDVSGHRKKELIGLYPAGYVNGYCAMSTQESVFDFENEVFINDGKIALYDMNTCEPITEAVYSGAKYFESGFCPVQKDSKWGFIDETGKEVTDFIFDDVSVVYEGKAYVGINGVYGVLDLAGTVSDNIPITMETCYPNGIPEGKEPEAGDIPYRHIGYAKIKVDNLNTRSVPGTDGEKRGKVIINNTYPVLEISSDDKYTWYKISDDAWVADQNGEWVEYTEK